MGKIIGIDLGTAYSRVAVFEGGEPVVLRDANGVAGLPSVIASDGQNTCFGEAALNRAELYPDRAFTDIRRRLGGSGEKSFGAPEITPAIVAGAIIRQLADRATEYLEERAEKVVLTVPSCATQVQRQDALNAVRRAGLEPVRLINEADAVLMDYACDRPVDEKVLVCSMGGGCLSVSVSEVSNDILQVMASGGLPRLGGLELDAALMKSVAGRFAQETGFDPMGDPVARARLRRAAEQARIALTAQNSAEVYVPCIGMAGGAPLHLSLTVTREQLEALIADDVARVSSLIRRLLAEARNCTPGALRVDTVILAGGCARTPAVQRAVRQLAGDARVIKTDAAAAARGAAVYGGVINGDRVGLMLLPATAYDLGVETEGGGFVTLISRGTSVPMRITRSVSTLKDNQPNIEVHLMEGLSQRAEDNFSVCRKQFPVPLAPRGVPQVSIELDISSDSIVALRQLEQKTGGEDGEETVLCSGLRDEPPLSPADDAAALNRVVMAMLPTLDNLELAIRAGRGSPGAEAIVKGVELTLRGMCDSLRKLGLEEIPAEGLPFDPAVHEAVDHRPGGRPGCVSAVVERGYRLNGRVIRYAKVVVSK